MTRIKKRRSGKKKTSDQQRTAAGRRRARSAAKTPAAPTAQDAASEATVQNIRVPKKKYEPVKGGRRGARSAKKTVTSFKEQRSTDNTAAKKSLPGKKTALAAKSTGKTRSAGARRVAVSRSVANTFEKKPVTKKTIIQKTGQPVSKKAGKGFAPWNKNRAKKKGKDA